MYTNRAFFADRFRVRLFPVLNRIIDQKKVRATAGKWTADADSIKRAGLMKAMLKPALDNLPILFNVKPLCALAVSCETHTRKNS